MKKNYKQLKMRLWLLMLIFGSLSYMNLYSQATGTVDIEAYGPNSAVLKIKTTAATGYRVEMMPDGGSYAEITAFADSVTHVDGFTYHLLKDLNETTKYYVKVIPFDGVGDGTPNIDSITTRTKGVLAYLKFESETNGRIVEETMGKTDSLMNANIVESGTSNLGKSVEFKRTETIPGTGLWDYSAIYLDSALMHNYDQIINGTEMAMSPTELTYCFWFKNNDTELSKTVGSTMFMAGDQFGSAIILYQDSLVVATGAKFGATNIFYDERVSFADDKWHHGAFVYEEGDVKFYLDGTEVISYNEGGKVFWNRLGVRMNDHWAKTMIGAAKWWNRPAQGIFGNYGDNLWHNQFNGLMDELKFFNYAFTPEEVAALRAEVLPAVTNLEVTARGPNSIVLGFKSADADTFEIKVRTGTDEFAESTPAKTVVQNGMYYYLISGLTEDMPYDFEVAGLSDLGPGTVATISSTTRKKEVMAYMKFDSESNGRIMEETMGKTDSLMNATLVPSINEALGNAVKFERTETIPGTGIWNFSAIYLDSALMHVYDQTLNATEMATSPTELSYSFWFKNNDTELSKTVGSTMFMAGEQFGSAIILYKDSLWVATGAKFGPLNIFNNKAVAFADDSWHHATFVYIEGQVKFYLDGVEAISFNEEEQFFWNRLGVRMNDHWAKNMIGAAYWWNRPAQGIFGTYGDKQWHNQFNGLMDELKIFSYALSEDEISSMVNEVLPATPVLSIAASGPNSLVLAAKVEDGSTTLIQKKTGTEEYTDVTPSKEVLQSSVTYYMLDGLIEGTDYSIMVTSMANGLSSAAAEISASTPVKEMMIHYTFESETDGKVTDMVTGEKDSLINASLVPSEFHNLGNAVKFQKTELVPGVPEMSTFYLDNAFKPYYNENSGTPVINYYNFTESSYALWFKVEDTDLASTGSILTAFGGSISNGIHLAQDSLYAANAVRFASNIFTNKSAPFKSTDWTHLAWVFKDGVTNVYLNGEIVITLDHASDYFWQSYNVRMNDKWAANQIGGCYWFNRALNPVTSENLGDQLWHHQFGGLMDDLRLYSYALTTEEIAVIKQESGVGVEEKEFSGVSIFPNPANEILYFNNIEKGSITVYDAVGTMVMTREINMDNSMNIQSLKDGLYIVKIVSENKSYSIKLIKK